MKTETSTPILSLKHLSKDFGQNKIIKDVNLDIFPKDIISIIGSSGTGKSTTLRCMNLMEEPSSGDILYHGESILDPNFDRNKFRSKVGMVFQQFNLFENLSVLENCTLGQIKVLSRSKAEAEAKAIEMLRKVNMEAYIDALPRQLSGGQQQRVAIARTLAMDPEVILFDEPTSALDPEMTAEVLDVMTALSSEDISLVIVSHMMNFAKDVSNKICFMHEGSIEEVGSPQEIFENPRSENLKRFLSKI